MDLSTNTSFINQASKFSIFPNPTSDMLTIESETPIAKVEIYNRIGELVLTEYKKNNIHLAGLSSGLYFCKMIDENGSDGMVKFVKY